MLTIMLLLFVQANGFVVPWWLWVMALVRVVVLFVAAILSDGLK